MSLATATPSSALDERAARSAVAQPGRYVDAPEKLALNESEAAAWLDVHPSTLARWRTEGIGPVSLKSGNHVAYLKSDLAAFEAGCRMPTQLESDKRVYLLPRDVRVQLVPAQEASA